MGASKLDGAAQTKDGKEANKKILLSLGDMS